jgi:Fic family protein
MNCYYSNLIEGHHTLSGDAGALVDEIFLRGEVARGEAARITRRPERTAREVLSKLVRVGLVASETPKGDVSLRFSSDSAHFLFPLLFPAQADAG